MSPQKPNIQVIWKEYLKMYEEEEYKTSFNERMIVAQEMFIKFLPYMFVTYFQSGVGSSVLRKNKHHRRFNRNL